MRVSHGLQSKLPCLFVATKNARSTKNGEKYGVWIYLNPFMRVSHGLQSKLPCLFVATKNARSTKNGEKYLYKMKYTDDWGNLHIHEVEQPDIKSKFFESNNMDDKHNQLGHADLALEMH
jgi:hypothetical protein